MRQITKRACNRSQYLAEIEFGDIQGLPFSDELWKHRPSWLSENEPSVCGRIRQNMHRWTRSVCNVQLKEQYFPHLNISLVCRSLCNIWPKCTGAGFCWRCVKHFLSRWELASKTFQCSHMIRYDHFDVQNTLESGRSRSEQGSKILLQARVAPLLAGNPDPDALCTFHSGFGLHWIWNRLGSNFYVRSWELISWFSCSHDNPAHVDNRDGR